MTALPNPLTESPAHRLARLMRSPAELMTPQRLSVIQPSRISASRALMAQAIEQRWKISCTRFDIDTRGRGEACYRIDIGDWTFSFPVFAFEPSAQGRTGRIIGRSWDMLGALVEGDISPEDFKKTGEELPKLYEGRATPGTLIWCRSNRSARFFNQAVEALAAGRQPDVGVLAETCYLMRNTGLDGNGTFGTKSFLAYEADHPLRWSLASQMLCAYMMRVYAQDLVQHLARLASPTACAMDPQLRRFLGVGNGSALGLMLFVNNHPRLIERWLWAREEALATAKGLPAAEALAQLPTLLTLLQRAAVFRRQDRGVYESFVSSAQVAEELAQVHSEAQRLSLATRADLPFDHLCRSLQGRIHDETLETLHSLLIELVPDTADGLCRQLILDEELVGEPTMPVARLRELLCSEYPWAFAMNLGQQPGEYVWYKSATAEEPRRGPREAVGEVANLGLDLPRLITALNADLARQPATLSSARFLLAHPWHRAIVTRVQALAGTPYHSPHADIMSEAFVPAHITRLLNVGLHGIDKTRDYLNRNLRGVLFHGAPLPEDLAAGNADNHWFYPSEPSL
ncbi:hypothetical protein [Pseudomonas typographi]|uniref:Uncharacterized protein n=1 Tax=Pseudomonas typographi TaxID=2715964 RepID=A0ABR7YVD8_9PSED|nr:hypothetical protein [Pseudomonas typographi]MBD1552142.1 hypothetical protein [Pseudomonas typographi]MBD1585114.1 hypothetical protein [Pseudomonas typographi]MBD1597161.1 hypothetical protein [Pseudomonas typographi]